MTGPRRAGLHGPPRCISLLTDYSDEAGFVGTLHAVAFSVAPEAVVIDLDHSIPAGDVRLGALRLERLTRFLPPGVHVGVVDPGVGGARRPIALRAARRLFVGPDNGLLVWAAEAAGGIDEVVVLDNEAYLLPGRARTFDGRDVFVPVACHLWLGQPLGEVGSGLDPAALVRIERPRPRRLPDGSVELEVVQVDGFGNVQFGAGIDDVERLGLRAGQGLVLRAGHGLARVVFGTTFSDVEPGQGVVLLDSDGQLAYSLNGGRADAALRLAPGARVVLEVV